ncbi:MAG: prepilin-type N-terminal cleavage/methylation domain-containing protein [bacterium]|nr:prepilin-type N-terminal cleavage/methylation domain-containing protein [bacterium]
MKSPKTSIHRQNSKFKIQNSKLGFTLIEVIIGMGILATIAAFGLFISMDVYRGNSFHTERNIIISILQKARSRAVNNINQISHGVCFQSGNYVIFEGPTCPGTNPETFPRGSSVSSTWPSEIVFDQLTGNTIGGSITITDGARTSIVTINNEGRISW